MDNLKFDKLNNTRDLGGIKVIDGRTVRSGKLIRSGRLAAGSEEDIKKIRELVSVVVDFRSPKERDEAPDPEMEGVSNIHIPIIDSLAAGVSREKQSDEKAFMLLADDPDGAVDYMCRTYEEFIASASARSGYRQFVDLLLKQRDGALLWHCTAGKDRAGFASVIILELLGADREEITRDYLETNGRNAEEVTQILEIFSGKMGGLNAKTEQALRHMFEARQAYLDAAYKKAGEMYGSIGAYLTRGLGIDGVQRDTLKDLYLV